MKARVYIKHQEWNPKTLVFTVKLSNGKTATYDNITELVYIGLIVQLPPRMFLPPRGVSCVDFVQEKIDTIRNNLTLRIERPHRHD